MDARAPDRTAGHAEHGLSIGIIGAGASGTLVALHALSDVGPGARRIELFERSGTFGRGVAYSTPHAAHLLNVPAGRMSAFPAEPDDFIAWLETQGHPFGAADFVPRHLFGTYLTDRLDQAIAARGGTVSVRFHHEGVSWVAPCGRGARVRTDTGAEMLADVVVLATGLGPVRDPIGSGPAQESDRYVANPWAPGALDGIGADDTVTLVGTGLTAIDAVSLLLTRRHRGPIHAFSRHGLFPRAHSCTPLPSPSNDGTVATWNGARSARDLLTAVRRQVDDGRAHGRDWRSVLDELRRQVPTLWTELPEAEQERFLRHLQRHWEVHRHRMAPTAADLIASAHHSGQLTVSKGSLDRVHVNDEGLLVTLRRGERCAGGWGTDWLVNCTGPRYALDFERDPLLRALADDGLVRPGPHGLGLDADRSGRVLDATGRSQDWLWAIGALRRGNLYETTAVAELRDQAAAIAQQLHSGAATQESSPRIPAVPAKVVTPQVIVLEVPDVGNRSYLVHDGTTGIVIDPPTDADRVVAEVDRGLTISHVLETHIHNDYVSGGLTLARRCNSVYGVAAGEAVAYGPDRRGLRDGDTLRAGSVCVEVTHTPGHTPHHLSYLASTGDGPSAWFTGGSLLYDATGRTDLFDPDATDILARAQWRSLNKQAKRLSPDTLLYPTHGFGSFCAAGSAGAAAGAVTLGDQLRRNLVLTQDEETFVSEVRRHRGPFPRYYAHMGPMNRQDASPRFPAELRRCERRVCDHDRPGSTIIDLRERGAFAASHWPGTVNVERGDTLAAFVGWTIPWGAPLTLVADEWDTVEHAAAALSRIGIEEVTGVTYRARADSMSYRVADFADLKSAISRGVSPVVVDAREHAEWENGHIEGATPLPFHCVEAGIDLLDLSAEIWVHCARGYRAAIAAALLQSRGANPGLIDDVFNHARELGLVTAR
jgi:hydroxyacylglutathione hydrolase